MPLSALTGSQERMIKKTVFGRWADYHRMDASLTTHIYQNFNGMPYETCPGYDQAVNFLESARSSVSCKLRIIHNWPCLTNLSAQIQSLLSNNSESLVLGAFGSNSLHFLGPSRGALPIGPNSIPGSDTLQPSPLSHAGTHTAILSYNYTLNHQGVTGNISCIYDTQSPITRSGQPNSDTFAPITGSCNETGLTEVEDAYGQPTNPYQISNYNSTGVLAIWGCYSQQRQAFYI